MRERLLKFFSRLFSFGRREKSSSNNTKKSDKKRGRRIHWRRGDYTLANSDMLFSAVSRIANSLSVMPIQLYQGTKAKMNDINDLVSFSPNPSMTSANFIKTLEACRCTYGNCYAFKVMNADGTIDRMDILDPSKVTPKLDIDSGELWYLVQPDSGEQLYIHGWYMIHVPFISTNGIVGINPAAVLADALDYSEKIQEFSHEQLEKGINAAIVLEAPASLGETQKADMVDAFMETYRNTSGNIVLLESGVTAKSMNLSPVDSKLFDVEKITRSKVAMVYNIPPHMLGDYSGTSYSSQEQEMLEFLCLTMLPIIRLYKQEFDKKLLTKEERKKGYHFEFDKDVVLLADASTQAEVDYKNVRSGIATPDEIRARKNIGGLPGGIGKHALVSQDLAPLDYTVNTKPKVLAAKLDRQSPSEGNNAGEGESN